MWPPSDKMCSAENVVFIDSRQPMLSFVEAARSIVRTTTIVCGVEHRAPPTFGRAAITLGIGPYF